MPLAARPRSASAALLSLSLLAAAAATAPLDGQELVTAFGRYQLDVWRMQDGVRLAFTSNMVETRDGYLWLSSESGVTRFDGVRFKVFDRTNAPALHGRPRLQTVPLLEDDDGVLWIGSDVGLFAYSNGSMRAAALDSSLTIDQVNAALVDPRGTMWGVTRSGRVIRIPRGGKLQEVSGTIVSYSSSSLAVDPSGVVWIVAGEGAVYRVDGDTLRRISFPPDLLVDDPTRIYVTSDSSIWFGTRTALIRLRHGRFQRIALPRRQALGALSSIQEDADGRLWIGTHGAGLYLFDGSRFVSFTSADGLSDDRVIEILRDRTGSMWVATRDGLNRFRPVPFDVITSRAGLPASMPGGMIGEPSGLIWLAPPTGGLFKGRISGERAFFDTAESVHNYDRVAAVAPARGGGVWAGHLMGSVSRHVDGRRPEPPVAQGLPPITELLEDEDGTLWIGTWRGLFRLRGGSIDTLTRQAGLPDEFVHRMHRATDGTLWVATQTGIARAKGGDESGFALHPMPEGSANRAIVLFEAPSGTLWLGSAEGLARVTGGPPAFISTDGGLPETWVGSGDEDASGNLWLGQLGGLTRVSLADLVAVADGVQPKLATATTFRALDGLPGGDPGAWPHPWTFKDRRGRIWVAMGHGIASIDPRDVPAAPRSPPVHLEEVWVDGAPVSAERSVRLAPSVRRVELRYTGVDLTDGPAVRFRHRLEGFDTTWVEAGSNRTVSYTRLPHGNYRFRVTARSGHGDWNPVEAGVDLVVLAPLYRRWWFMAAAFAAIAMVLWTAHLLRLQARDHAVREERTRLAREIHDSLLQGFGGIALQLHAASARLSLPPDQSAVMNRVLGLLDRTLTQARAAVWDMRMPGAAPAGFAAEIEDAATRILGGSTTEARVLVRGRSRAISAAARSELLRIVEEALTNVRMHAEATSVLVEIVHGWRRLRLTIRDDGRGFDLAGKSTRPGHWGLLGMRERASRIGARLSVETDPGAGTRVSVTVPYRLGWGARWKVAGVKD